MDVVILGAGPAALTLAIALHHMGVKPTVIGRPRARPAIEGISYRVAQGLRQLGCRTAFELLGTPWRRLSCWAGTRVEMNGEFVVERQAFDAALREDASRAGCDLRSGLVRNVQLRAPGEWEVFWEDSEGGIRETHARFVVESRGRAAPKWGPDLHAGEPLLALTRAFRTTRRGLLTTFTESFAEGWAWGTVRPGGEATVQVVMHPETLKCHGGDRNAAHAACMERLVQSLDLLGKGPTPLDETGVRGIQSVLRGDCVRHDQLRVGDAAYTTDPLSGHGLFEAVSGALAAAPTVRTFLERPASAAAACEFYESRVRNVYLARIKAAQAHYRSEVRWPDSVFWRRMHALSAPGLALQAQPREAAFASQAVVENGFITRRRVACTPEHPRGVRFIDGIDLAVLHDLLQQSASGTPSVKWLSAHFGGHPDAIRSAGRWLVAHRLLESREYNW